MEQRVGRVAPDEGTRVAYAMSGAGPPLVYVAGWLTHLERGWALPPERAFYEALSEGRTLVRYDKPGCGLSEPTDRRPSIALELEALDAVAGVVGGGRFDLLGTSLGAAVAVHWAAAHPDKVGRLILYGGWLQGAGVATEEVQRSILQVVATHWGLGSGVLADIFALGADAPTRDAFVRYQRDVSSAETAVRMLALSYESDVTDIAGKVSAPTLVLHRRDDRAAPLAEGRRLADAIPGARLEILPGRAHLPYIGDVSRLTSAIRRFLGLAPPRRSTAPRLTPRQREVAELVSQGLHNREIAALLGINERSAEGHVERIRQRLGFRSRAQIAAWFVASKGPD